MSARFWKDNEKNFSQTRFYFSMIDSGQQMSRVQRVVHSAHTQSETLRNFMPLRTNRSYAPLAVTCTLSSIVHSSFCFASNPSSLDAKKTGYHAFWYVGYSGYQYEHVPASYVPMAFALTGSDREQNPLIRFRTGRSFYTLCEVKLIVTSMTSVKSLRDWHNR